MRIARSWTGVLCLLTGCTPAAELPDLDALIARHVEARGGAAAIEAVQTYETDIHIVEPTFEVDGTYIATRDGRMRIDIRAGDERVFAEGLHRGRSWSWSPGNGVREGSDQGTAALRHGIEFPLKLFGLHELRDRGHRLRLARRETVEGIDYYVLALVLDDGFESWLYLHPESLLIERERQFRALHVDVDPTREWIETVFSDFRPVAGVLFPFRQIDRQVSTGRQLASVEVREIRLNHPVALDRTTAS